MSSSEIELKPPTLEDFKTLDRMDEEQILSELQGKTIDKLFYQLPNGVTALSWAGVKYFTISRGNIYIDEVKLTEDEEYYRVVAWVRDVKMNVRMMGAAEQSKKETWGKHERDQFALAKVVSKAQRNALRNLIPETIISAAFKEWMGKQKK